MYIFRLFLPYGLRSNNNNNNNNNVLLPFYSVDEALLVTSEGDTVINRELYSHQFFFTRESFNTS